MREAVLSAPKLTFPEAEANFLEQAYKEAKVILEYGSGGSTMLASAMHGKRVFSVESDPLWAMRLQRMIDRSNLPSPATVYFTDIGPTGDWGRPKDNRAWRQFHHYPSRIWSEQFFRHPDTVLIDGRFRPACLIGAWLRISKPVRVLFDDYTERPSYHVVEQMLKPTSIVGRLAEFVLDPVAHSTSTYDFYQELCTRVSLSTEEPANYSL